MAIDIGAGTEDILLYDDAKTIENSIKMVLPSPSLIYAEKIEELTSRGQNVLIKGDIIGGGAVTSVVKKHIEKGLKVVMTEKAALTIRNNLDEVRAMGIEVVKEESELSKLKGTLIGFEEVNIWKIMKFLRELGVKTGDVDVVAVAVQDHGVNPPGESNRRFRMKKIEELLTKNPGMEALAFEEKEVPDCFLRMRSTVESCKLQLPNSSVIVMDTAMSALLGCLEDPGVIKNDRIVAVNAGNGHTIAAILEGERILGLMEHHTRMLSNRSEKLEQQLLDFANGRIKGDDIFNDGGHGAFYLKPVPGREESFSIKGIGMFAATGPNRSMVGGLKIPFHFAAPGGDVMMTGTLGLIRATLRKL